MKKVAVVGFGFMGMTHVINILKNKDLELVAIVDKRPGAVTENLLRSAGNFSTGQPDTAALEKINQYISLDECLDRENIDAVHICVHTSLHYELAKQALLHNKHVFLEKPFCLDVSQAEELIRLAEQQQKLLMVGHVLRFMPQYQKLKQWIDSNEFGKLRFLSLNRFSGVPAWGQWKDRGVMEASGGALFDLVIHDIDFANYLLGMPTTVKCSYLPGGLSRHDYISAMWHYQETGVHVKIEGGNIFHAGFPFQAGFMARFDEASVHYTTMKGDVITIADDAAAREVPSGDAGSGYYNEIAYFAQCMENNMQPAACTPASSLQAVQLCYQSLCL